MAGVPPSWVDDWLMPRDLKLLYNVCKLISTCTSLSGAFVMQSTLPGVLMPGKQWGGNVIKLGVGGMWVMCSINHTKAEQSFVKIDYHCIRAASCLTKLGIAHHCRYQVMRMLGMEPGDCC